MYQMRSKTVYIALSSALGLFVLFLFQGLDKFSSLTDSPWKGMDHFSLPRCAIAFWADVTVFDSHTFAKDFGPWSSNWASHPLLCATLGTLFAGIPPWTGYWVATGFYFLIFCFLIFSFLFQLPKEKSRVDLLKNVLFCVFIGFSMPWYTLFNQGNYHAFVVLGLGLILLKPESTTHSVAGFALSAFGKPLLMPHGMVYLIQKRWKVVFLTVAIVAVGSLLTFENVEELRRFIDIGRSYSGEGVFRWNQQQGIETVIQETLLRPWSYQLRLSFTVVTLIFGLLLLYKKRTIPALAVISTWYFWFNARGHEYHWTLFTPILLALYVNDLKYRNFYLVFLTALISMPNAYPLFHLVGQFQSTNDLSNSRMFELSPTLYALFLIPKPLSVLVFLLLVFKTEVFSKTDVHEMIEHKT
jgi:hypothetical protein